MLLEEWRGVIEWEKISVGTVLPWSDGFVCFCEACDCSCGQRVWFERRIERFAFSLKNSFNFSYNNQKAVSANKEEALLKKNQAEEAVLEKKNADAEALKKLTTLKKSTIFKKMRKKTWWFETTTSCRFGKGNERTWWKSCGIEKEIEELDKNASDYQDRLAELNEKIEQADKDLQDFKQKQEDDYAKLAQELSDQQKQLNSDLLKNFRIWSIKISKNWPNWLPKTRQLWIN